MLRKSRIKRKFGCHRSDVDPVGRDLSEQYIRDSSWNPGIYLRSNRISQSDLRTGLRPGSIEDDHHQVHGFHGSSGRRSHGDGYYCG